MPTVASPFPNNALNTLTVTQLNSAFANWITAINSGNGDPNDTTNGYGGAYSQFGPGLTDAGGYYNLHGPGGASTDWYSAGWNTAAAIPADPALKALDPSTTTVTKSKGIAVEMMMQRGALNILAGRAATTDWGATPFPGTLSLAQINPGSAQAGSINLDSSHSVTAGQLISTAASGTAPLIVASGTVVAGLNAAMVADVTGTGHPATQVYGAGNAGSLLNLNGNGLYDAAAIGYDSAEAATLDTLSSTSTITNSLNRMRYELAQLSTASGRTGVWTDQATSLLTSINAGGSLLKGDVTLAASTGLQLVQAGQTLALTNTGVTSLTAPDGTALTSGIALAAGTNITINRVGNGLTINAATTTAPAAGDSLTFSDFQNAYSTATTVMNGLAITATPGTLLSAGVSVASGTAYIPTSSGGSRQSLTGLTISSATTPALTASKDNYIDWNGTNSLSGFTVTAVTLGAAAPSVAAQSIRLAKVPTSATAIMGVSDLRDFGKGVGRSIWLNILELGGLPGGTDCSPALNLAMQIARRVGSVTVYYPPASSPYVHSSQLVGPTDVQNPLLTAAVASGTAGATGFSVNDNTFWTQRPGGAATYVAVLDPGTANAEAVTINGVTGSAAPYTVTFSSPATLAHTHNAGASLGVNTSSSSQRSGPSVRITGGNYPITQAVSGPFGAGGSVLDFQWNSYINDGATANAKIDFRGNGTLEIDHVTIMDSLSTGIPLVQVTNTVPQFHDAYYFTPTIGLFRLFTFPTNDAIVLGGTDAGPSGGPQGYFGGFGGVIHNCAFQGVRRIIVGQSDCNSVIITAHWATGVGSPGFALIDIPGNSTWKANGNKIRDCVLETYNSTYGIQLANALGNTLIANDFYDDLRQTKIASGGYVANAATVNTLHYIHVPSVFSGGGIALRAGTAGASNVTYAQVTGSTAAGNLTLNADTPVGSGTIVVTSIGTMALDAGSGTQGILFFNTGTSAPSEWATVTAIAANTPSAGLYTLTLAAGTNALHQAVNTQVRYGPFSNALTGSGFGTVNYAAGIGVSGFAAGVHFTSSASNNEIPAEGVIDSANYVRDEVAGNRNQWHSSTTGQNSQIAQGTTFTSTAPVTFQGTTAFTGAPTFSSSMTINAPVALNNALTVVPNATNNTPIVLDALAGQTANLLNIGALIPGPGAVTAGAPTTGGSLTVGTSRAYRITFVTAAGETTQGGLSSTQTPTTGNQTIPLSSIPLGPSSTTERNLYVSISGGAMQLIHTLADNTTTTYNDTGTGYVVDGRFTSGNAAPTTNTALQSTSTSFDNFGVLRWNVANGSSAFIMAATNKSGATMFGVDAQGNLTLGNPTTQTSAPAAGAASALPATPAGYVTVNIAGVARKIAFY